MCNKNNRVPFAILSCFLIAFILQGILKMSGVFIFEKALDWEIFNVIDKSKILTILFQWIINIVAVHCLAFALTTKGYSDKWYHYLLVFIPSLIIVILRSTTNVVMWLEYLYDIILYVIIPIIINLTSKENIRLFTCRNTTNIVLLTSIQILLYFCYLGLCYWSSLLSSFIIMSQITMYASASFLVFFEMYIGLALLMLSLNIIIKKIKEK